MMCTARVGAFIALGANLGDPVAQVRAGLASLATIPDTDLVRASSLYRTAPVGVRGQDPFINAVAMVQTGLRPKVLLEHLLALEITHGRVRNGTLAPRTLDLDLLLHGDSVMTDAALTLPHPRLHLRAFVLVPLSEIAPETAVPGRGTVAAWLPATAYQKVERL
jgi:2-amino-4-hydroxy-6-hydroxymethyldihydropteridine diphosphokinase